MLNFAFSELNSIAIFFLMQDAQYTAETISKEFLRYIQAIECCFRAKWVIHWSMKYENGYHWMFVFFNFWNLCWMPPYYTSKAYLVNSENGAGKTVNVFYNQRYFISMDPLFGEIRYTIGFATWGTNLYSNYHNKFCWLVIIIIIRNLKQLVFVNEPHHVWSSSLKYTFHVKDILKFWE